MMRECINKDCSVYPICVGRKFGYQEDMLMENCRNYIPCEDEEVIKTIKVLDKNYNKTLQLLKSKGLLYET